MTDTLYLGKTREGKQVGLFRSHEEAFAYSDKINTADIWNLDEKTGRFYPTNGSVGRLELVPKKEEFS